MREAWEFGLKHNAHAIYYGSEQNKQTTMIHIGEVIKLELQRQERSISWFARKLYCDRSNVYDIFQRKSIDTELLFRICIILNYNFFSLYDNEFIQNSNNA